jgi:hypothetical protein
MSNRLGRRQLLQLGGVAGIATLAGCLGGDDENGDDNSSSNGEENGGGNGGGNGSGNENGDENGSENGEEAQPDTEVNEDATLEAGEIPAFAEFVSANGNLIVAHTTQPGTQAAKFSPQPVDTVPTYLGDVEAIVRSSDFTMNLFTNSFGLGGLVGGETTFETTIDEMMEVLPSFVATGDIDTEEIGERVQTTSGREGDDAQATLEPDGEFGEYTLYAAPPGSQPTPQGNLPAVGGMAIDTMAVTESTLVVGPRESVERSIEASRGDQTRATDDFDPFAWLVSVGNDADTVYANYSPDGLAALSPSLSELTTEEAAPVNDATGRGASLTFGDGTVDVEVGLVFDQTISADKQAALAALPRPDVEDATLAVDDNRALLTVTYDSSTISQ